MEPDYLEAHSEPEHSYLHELWRATHLHLNYPRMASGHLQGQFLRMITLMLRPKLVLEIGTFTGYSALAMASALEPGAMLHTFEINDEQEDFTRPWLENSPWADKIQFHIGDALEWLKREPQELLSGERETAVEPRFDLAFIDANKRQYTEYYEAVLPHIRPGGIIIADNTLWSGQVFQSPANLTSRESAAPTHNGKQAELNGILAFNERVATDMRVEKVILPIRDGITLIRKRGGS